MIGLYMSAAVILGSLGEGELYETRSVSRSFPGGKTSSAVRRLREFLRCARLLPPLTRSPSLTEGGKRVVCVRVRAVGDAGPYKVGAPFRLPQWGKAWIARWETDSAILGFPWGRAVRDAKRLAEFSRWENILSRRRLMRD